MKTAYKSTEATSKYCYKRSTWFGRSINTCSVQCDDCKELVSKRQSLTRKLLTNKANTQQPT